MRTSGCATLNSQMPSGTPSRMPGTKSTMRRHSISGQSRSAWRIDTKAPRNVMSGAAVDSGSAKTRSGVATTPEPNPATPRTA